MVGDAVVNGADQVRRLRVVELEGEVAFCVRLGARRFFHALPEAEQNYIVAGGGLAGGGVLHGAGKGLSGGERCEEKREG